MYLTERHVISKGHNEWPKLDYLCYISKNLFNYANFLIKQQYQEDGKYLFYNIIDKKLRDEKHENYFELPNNSSQQVLLSLHRSYQAFFKSLRSWKKDKTKFEGCPKPPKYKHKTKGRHFVPFTYQQVRIKDNYLRFPKKTGLKPLRTKVEPNNLKYVRIVPQSNCYVIEIIYEQEEVDYNLNQDNYIGIDLGIDNLCSISSNQPGLNPILVNGKIVKSMNQYFNKVKGEIQTQLQKNHKKKSSRRLSKFQRKRNEKIKNYMHHVSKFIVNYCVENDINNIVIGKNKKWKHECNIGKMNNQNFIQIPFETLISQIQYKAQLVGINVKLVEESYTSKCSALDLEPIKKHDSYIGKRVKRGLFRYSSGLVNADINGSLNILRKEIGDGFINLLNRGLVLNPVKVNPLQKEQYKFSPNFI